jgi:SAM-dependent methyltransferase
MLGYKFYGCGGFYYKQLKDTNMDYTKLKEQWFTEEKAGLTGWDFSHLNGRWQQSPLKWEYVEIVRNYLKDDNLLLDMGTGGGEVLLTIGHPHNLTYITESYPPNVELCKQKLTPLGIHVSQVYDDNLPFDDGMFDIVINRHESFDMREVNRVLKTNGYFITQQVGGENIQSLHDALGFENLVAYHTLKSNVDIIKEHGFDVILQDECLSEAKFFDVGAIVYYVKAVPWNFPDFSVERCFPQLVNLHEHIEANGDFISMWHRFIILARKR